MDADTLFERKSDLVAVDLDGELVMMDVNQGSYFAINPVGAHIWTQLEAPKTVSALIASTEKAFKATDTSEIQTDVRNFLTDLAANKLINEIAP